MTRALGMLLLMGVVWGQEPPVAKLAAECADTELAEFGLVCDEEEPCPVQLELAHVEAVGLKVFVSGNFYAGRVTLWSLLLVSADSGKTWEEPWPRQKGVALDQIQFVDFETGWVAGHRTGPLPRDPFLLRTPDGGKTWRRLPVFDDTVVGVVEWFRFASKETGTMVAQRRGGKLPGRYQRLESRDGGQSWMLREVTDEPIARAAETPAWRIRADSKSGTLRLEKQEAGGKWAAAARFALRAGECKPASKPPVEPPVVDPPGPGVGR